MSYYSKDYRCRPNGPYKRPQQPVYLASRQQRHTPSQPIVLTTNFTSKYSQPQAQLQISPDSTGSTAADESTPPPMTPSLHAPSSSVDRPIPQIPLRRNTSNLHVFGP